MSGLCCKEREQVVDVARWTFSGGESRGDRGAVGRFQERAEERLDVFRREQTEERLDVFRREEERLDVFRREEFEEQTIFAEGLIRRGTILGASFSRPSAHQVNVNWTK